MKPISRRKASDIYHDGKKSVVDTIDLSRENVRLKEKLLLNSTNSSKPPSSDVANVKPKKEKTKSKNKPGRPHGHIGKTRDLLQFVYAAQKARLYGSNRPSLIPGISTCNAAIAA